MKVLINKHFYIFCSSLILFFLLLNIVGITYGMNFLIIIVLVIAIFRKEGFEFLKDFSIPLALLYLYEVLRANAYPISQSLGVNLLIEELIAIESTIFFFLDEIPTVVLQRTFLPVLSNPQWYDYTLFIMYSVYFWIWGIAAIFIWFQKRKYFKAYVYGLVAYGLFCVLIYVLAPTAPPWYASETGYLPYIERILWKFEYIDGAQIYSIQEIGGNPFAALPSLHTGWASYSYIYIVRTYGKKMLPLFVIPLGIAFATWYGAEHYVIDSLVGLVLAILFYIVSVKYFGFKAWDFKRNGNGNGK